MITVRNVSKHYGSVVAVDDVSFNVEPGRVTGFLGPNGAGKSTTMRIVMGLDRPGAGTALINGRRYGEFSAPLREVGALLDAGAIHPGRTGRSHLRIAARSNGIPRARVDEVIDQVGLESAAGRRIKGYSLGMRQRLGIASALLGDPGVLLFDEPVNGLDVDGVRWVRSLMRRLADEGRTVLVSSHLMSEMQLIADQVLVIGRGRLVADSSLADILGSLGSQRVRVRTPALGALVGALERRQVETERTGPDEAVVSGLAALELGLLALDHGIVLSHLSDVKQSLEQAYLTLTQDAGDFHVASSEPALAAGEGHRR